MNQDVKTSKTKLTATMLPEETRDVRSFYSKR